MERRELLKTLAYFGVVVSSPLANALQAGVTATSKASSSAFSADQKQMVSILAELIIPETDTPGANEAGVPRFIETLFFDWYSDVEREIFLKGLAAVDEFCQLDSGTPFSQTDEAVQTAALREQERLASDYRSPPKRPGAGLLAEDRYTPFFTKLKDLVVVGYFTSEVGSKQELHYLPVPGHYDGEFEFNKVGHQWSH